MSKQKKYITINGIEFELCGTTTGNKDFYSGAAYNEIFNVYGRPSDTKISIWYEWCEWAYKFDCALEICSHSCMFFSISGVCKWDGKVYGLYITYAHNRAYEII